MSFSAGEVNMNVFSYFDLSLYDVYFDLSMYDEITAAKILAGDMVPPDPDRKGAVACRSNSS